MTSKILFFIFLILTIVVSNASAYTLSCDYPDGIAGVGNGDIYTTHIHRWVELSVNVTGNSIWGTPGSQWFIYTTLPPYAQTSPGPWLGSGIGVYYWEGWTPLSYGVNLRCRGPVHTTMYYDFNTPVHATGITCNETMTFTMYHDGIIQYSVTGTSYDFLMRTGHTYNISSINESNPNSTIEWHNFTATTDPDYWEVTNCGVYTVSGRILAADNEGVYNTTILLKHGYTLYNITNTSSNGTYSFSGIPYGIYYIEYIGLDGSESTTEFVVNSTTNVSDYGYYGLSYYRAYVTLDGNPAANELVQMQDLTTEENYTYQYASITNASGYTPYEAFSNSPVYFDVPKYSVSTSCLSDAWKNYLTCTIAVTSEEIDYNVTANRCTYGWCYLANMESNQTYGQINADISSLVAISSFNGTTQRYVSYRNGRSINENYTVLQRYGYSIFITSARIITKDVPNSVAIQLYAGWNLVGNTAHDENDRTIGNITYSLGGITNYVQYFDGNVWQSADETVIPPGAGFMLYVENDVLWLQEG